MSSLVKHAVIAASPGEESLEKHVEADVADGQKVYLVEREYTQEELDAFNAEKPNWILRRAGTRFFMADSDSGEDATGHYCGYFDLRPENAVFDGGKLVGYYLCAGDFRYSGRGRASFDVESWGYPGDNPFVFVSWGHRTHVFLFSEAPTHEWEDWDLLARDPDKQYASYIDF